MSKMHRWTNDAGDGWQWCAACGIYKRVVRIRDNFVRTEYVDQETGETWLRAPVCS